MYKRRRKRKHQFLVFTNNKSNTLLTIEVTIYFLVKIDSQSKMGSDSLINIYLITRICCNKFTKMTFKIIHELNIIHVLEHNYKIQATE
jgi:hypothetical protein